MPTGFPTWQQMRIFEHGVSSLVETLPKIATAIILIVLGLILAKFVALLTLKLLNTRRLLKQEFILLQLIPPGFADQTPLATSELFVRFHGFDTIRSLADKLRKQYTVFSLEIVASRAEGIRYMLRVPKTVTESITKDIAAFSPDIRTERIADYLPGKLHARTALVTSFRQSGRSFAYPLRFSNSLVPHDPVAYLTSAMVNLQPDELIALQLVVSPAKLRRAEAIARNLLHNDEHLESLGNRRHPIGRALLGAISTLLFAGTDMVSDLYHSSSSIYTQRSQRPATHHRELVAAGLKPARSLTALEQGMAQAVYDKLSRPLFRADIRSIVLSPRSTSRRDKTNDLRKALGSLRTNYQSLYAPFAAPVRTAAVYRTFLFQHRLPGLLSRDTSVLSTAELAGIWHFPHSETARTEGVVKTLSRTLAAPQAIKNNADHGTFDVVIGRNHHLGRHTDIGLTAVERERHLYVVGGTGNGKTTMLEYAIVQDIRNGKGVAVVDPHGDLAKRLLRYIPENRIRDVIYFNPADLGYPIGINLLEMPEGLEGDELLDAKDFITEAVVSVMRKVFSEDDSGGHRIEYVLRNTVQTALTLKEPTLFTIFDLLTDTKFRKKVIKNLEDPKLRNFWTNEFSRAGDFQRVKMAGGVTAKIGRFQFSASAARILSQPKSTINFDEILDGKILICNFAKGLIGEDTSELFGVTVLAKIQLAAYRRVKTNQKDRKPFYLYVDEFQNFATMSFVQMLSEARKYRVFLTMAEQSTSQQEDLRMVNTILANVGTVVAFRSGNPADERMLLPLFKPYISEGELANLPTYNFYARLAAVLPQEPVSGETLLLADVGSQTMAAKVIAASRANYAKKHLADVPALAHRERADTMVQERISKKPTG